MLHLVGVWATPLKNHGFSVGIISNSWWLKLNGDPPSTHSTQDVMAESPQIMGIFSYDPILQGT